MLRAIRYVQGKCTFKYILMNNNTIIDKYIQLYSYIKNTFEIDEYLFIIELVHIYTINGFKINAQKFITLLVFYTLNVKVYYFQYRFKTN